MAHVLSYRNGERSKGKSFEKMPSAVATQRITSPSAKSRSTKRRQDDTSLTSELNIFFNTFPNKIIENEQFLLQQIYEAWRTRDLDTMFRLIKENEFSDLVKSNLMKLWDTGHYYRAEIESGKPLTPLARFRIRERHVPPKSICPNGRPKATLPKEATQVLREWLKSSPTPYPTRENKETLAKRTGLSVMQVNTWFANTRRRMSGKRSKSKKDNGKHKPQPLKWTSSQAWQVISPTIMTSASAFTPCASVCACPGGSFPQILGEVNQHLWEPASLASAVPKLWNVGQLNTTMLEWPASHATTLANEYLSAPVVALAPNVWKPELQYCGLHAAARILMDMASK